MISDFNVELAPTKSQTVGSLTYNEQTGLHEQGGQVIIDGLAKLATHRTLLEVNGKSIWPNIQTRLVITAGTRIVFPDPENRQTPPVDSGTNTELIKQCIGEFRGKCLRHRGKVRRVNTALRVPYTRGDLRSLSTASERHRTSRSI